jgi:hypothetical protein
MLREQVQLVFALFVMMAISFLLMLAFNAHNIIAKLVQQLH